MTKPKPNSVNLFVLPALAKTTDGAAEVELTLVETDAKVEVFLIVDDAGFGEPKAWMVEVFPSLLDLEESFVAVVWLVFAATGVEVEHSAVTVKTIPWDTVVYVVIGPVKVLHLVQIVLVIVLEFVR